MRKARPQVPSHLHTAADFARPTKNYQHEPIFPAAVGKVVSLRDDGPFAQIIIEHECAQTGTVWTVYEHVAGIQVTIGEEVAPDRAIGRFMTREELNRYGWQFNHLHFEIMKKSPRTLQPNGKTPHRFYDTYALTCYTRAHLHERYHDPILFLQSRWK